MLAVATILEPVPTKSFVNVIHTSERSMRFFRDVLWDREGRNILKKHDTLASSPSDLSRPLAKNISGSIYVVDVFFKQAVTPSVERGRIRLTEELVTALGGTPFAGEDDDAPFQTHKLLKQLW